MARKASKRNRWLETDRAGGVTLYRTARSPYWWMYWIEPNGQDDEKRSRSRPREFVKSTRETDLRLARVVAAQKNEELFTQQRYPDLEKPVDVPVPFRPRIAEFVDYLEKLGRSHEYIRKLKSRLTCLADWMQARSLTKLQDINPQLLQRFSAYLQGDQKLTNASVNHYVTAIHNFYGFVAFKRQLVSGTNPAKTGRQAVLDKLPTRRLPPPTIYPDQVNAVIEMARQAGDYQIVNLIVFVCEGGFRFQELQFLQVWDIDLAQHEIRLDVKRPCLDRVRPELRRRCLTSEGYWMPKSIAGRRVIHITDRLAKAIASIGLGESSDWVFMNQAGRQIAENKTLLRLKGYAIAAKVLVEPHPKTGKPWSLLRWHWLRHYHRTRAHVSKIRREVSKLAMGHAADGIHDHYRGVDAFAFHEEYAKFDSGLDVGLIGTSWGLGSPVLSGTNRVLDFSSCKSLLINNLRMEAGGIDSAEKRVPSVKTPHLARIAVRCWTYSDTKVHRRTQSDKEFERSFRKSSRNGPGCPASRKPSGAALVPHDAFCAGSGPGSIRAGTYAAGLA